MLWLWGLVQSEVAACICHALSLTTVFGMHALPLSLRTIERLSGQDLKPISFGNIVFGLLWLFLSPPSSLCVLSCSWQCLLCVCFYDWLWFSSLSHGITAYYPLHLVKCIELASVWGNALYKYYYYVYFPVYIPVLIYPGGMKVD